MTVDVTRVVLKGLPGESTGYTRYGQVLLGNLVRMMEFQRLNQGMSRTILLDGTEIVCQSVYGQKQVTITTAARGVEERKFLLTLEPVMDKYLFVYGAGTNMQPPYTYLAEDPYVKFYIFDPFNPKDSERFRLSKIRDRATDYNYKNNMERGEHLLYGYLVYNELTLTLSWQGWDRFSTISCPFSEFPGLTWIVSIGEASIGYFQQRAPIKIIKIFNQYTGAVLDEFIIKGVQRSLAVHVDGVDTTIPYFHALYYSVEHITSVDPPHEKTIKISQSGEWRSIPTSEYPVGQLHSYVKIETIIGKRLDGKIGIVSKEGFTITYAGLTTISSFVDSVGNYFYILDVITRTWITRHVDYVPTREYDYTSSLDDYPSRSCDLCNFYPLDMDARAAIEKTWTETITPYGPPMWYISYLSTIYHYDISYLGASSIKFLDSNVTNDGLDNPDSLVTSCIKHFIPTVSVCYGRQSALLAVASHTKAHQYFSGLPGSEWTDGPPADGELRQIYFKNPTKGVSGVNSTRENIGGTDNLTIKSFQRVSTLTDWTNITSEILLRYHALTNENFDFQKLFGIFLYKD
jgi:hypothetical protein